DILEIHPAQAVNADSADGGVDIGIDFAVNEKQILSLVLQPELDLLKKSTARLDRGRRQNFLGNPKYPSAQIVLHVVINKALALKVSFQLAYLVIREGKAGQYTVGFRADAFVTALA